MLYTYICIYITCEDTTHHTIICIYILQYLLYEMGWWIGVPLYLPLQTWRRYTHWTMMMMMLLNDDNNVVDMCGGSGVYHTPNVYIYVYIYSLYHICSAIRCTRLETSVSNIYQKNKRTNRRTKNITPIQALSLSSSSSL